MRTITPKEFSTFVGVGPYPERYRIMDKADIAQMVEWFAAAALRAKQANFDAVEVHCAHNYMIANFLSPFFNSRTDEYGGSYENRSRLLREVLTEVRRRVGPDYPVWVRLDAQEMHTPGGITMDEALKTARLCEELGMDAISVSAYARMPTGSAFTDAPIPQKQNAYREFARQFKQSVSLPIISAGRWELDDAADAVTRGDRLRGHGPQAAGRARHGQQAAGQCGRRRAPLHLLLCLRERNLRQPRHQVRRQCVDRS